MSIQNPEKELRFTRAAQAMPYFYGAAVLGGGGIIMLACSWYRDINPALPHPLWALLPIIVAWILGKLAAHMVGHAYIILTPLGVEILPLIRPRSGMRLIYWQEIDSIEANEAMTHLTLHFDADKTGGVHLSLRPIPGMGRELLIHALQQRIAKK